MELLERRRGEIAAGIAAGTGDDASEEIFAQAASVAKVEERSALRVEPARDAVRLSQEVVVHVHGGGQQRREVRLRADDVVVPPPRLGGEHRRGVDAAVA